VIEFKREVYRMALNELRHLLPGESGLRLRASARHSPDRAVAAS
jgi:hypothetical protein